MARGFEDILEECLDRLLQGESLEQCLKRYPEQAQELEPLLKVALVTRKAASIEPRPEFKGQARYQIQSAVHARKQRRFPLLGWQWRWATVVITLLILLLAFGGTVAASANSLPDETLYPVKLTTERIRLALTFSDMDKAKLHAEFASRRAEEMARMTEKGKPEKVEALVSRFNTHLERIEQVVKQGKPRDEAKIAELKEKLQQSALRDKAILQRAEKRAPEHAKLAIREAGGKLEESYKRAFQAFEEEKPSYP